MRNFEQSDCSGLNMSPRSIELNFKSTGVHQITKKLCSCGNLKLYCTEHGTIVYVFSGTALAELKGDLDTDENCVCVPNTFAQITAETGNLLVFERSRGNLETVRKQKKQKS